jgi:hypothetical protein
MSTISLIIACTLFFQKASKKDVSHTYEDVTDFLARFVINSQGEKIGESIAVDNDILIVKDKKTLLGIPLKHVSFEGKKLLAKGLIDTTKAKKLGNTWKKEAYKEISYPDEEQ